MIIPMFVYGCFHFIFVIPGLVYVVQGTECVKTLPPDFSLTLSTWLQIDAYLRLIVIIIFISVFICIYKSVKIGYKIAASVYCIIMSYCLISFIWTIIGSVLFWGKLNPTGVCTGNVKFYTYFVLIVNYVSICWMLFIKCGQDAVKYQSNMDNNNQWFSIITFF